jgi:transposase
MKFKMPVLTLLVLNRVEISPTGGCILTRSNRRACHAWSQQKIQTKIPRKCEECGHPLFLNEAGKILCTHCGVEYPFDQIESN